MVSIASVLEIELTGMTTGRHNSLKKPFGKLFVKIVLIIIVIIIKAYAYLHLYNLIEFLYLQLILLNCVPDATAKRLSELHWPVVGPVSSIGKTLAI